MTTYCKVLGCRFSQFHTTVAHRCGTCLQYGHGQMECSDNIKKIELSQYIEDQMPEHRWCNYVNCTYPWSHSPESHHCFACGVRSDHSVVHCPKYQEQYGGEPIFEGGGAYSSDLSGSLVVNSLLEGAATKNPEFSDRVAGVAMNKQCPMCLQSSDVDLNMKIFTDAKCVVCIESGPKVVFSGCKHAIICDKCVLNL